MSKLRINLAFRFLLLKGKQTVYWYMQVRGLKTVYPDILYTIIIAIIVTSFCIQYSVNDMLKLWSW